MSTAQPDANNLPETSGPPGPSEDTAQPRNSSTHLCHNDAGYLPDWRWQRAQMLLMSGEAPSGDRDDEFVELALGFLQEATPGTDSPASKHLLPAQTKAAIQTALQIYGCEDTQKWALQAWLLTGESPELISQQTSLPTESIHWYAKLLFDVQGRLSSPGFIIHRVVGPKIHYGLSVKDVGVIWAYCAFRGGRCVLEALLKDFIEAGKEDYSYLLDGTYRDADLPLERRLLQQALRVQLLSTEDIFKILDLALKDPKVTAKAKTFSELIELLVAPEMGYLSEPVGGEPEIPVQNPQETPPCGMDVAGAA